jgi:hypothetical protein
MQLVAVVIGNCEPEKKSALTRPVLQGFHKYSPEVILLDYKFLGNKIQ